MSTDFDPYATLPPGVTYSGDANPIPHGGSWFAMRPERADVVRIDADDDFPEGDYLVMRVETGSVQLSEATDEVLRFADLKADAPDDAKAEAIVAYRGLEDVDPTIFVLRDDDEPHKLSEMPRALRGLIRDGDVRAATREDVIAYLRAAIANF